MSFKWYDPSIDAKYIIVGVGLVSWGAVKDPDHKEDGHTEVPTAIYQTMNAGMYVSGSTTEAWGYPGQLYNGLTESIKIQAQITVLAHEIANDTGGYSFYLEF